MRTTFNGGDTHIIEGPSQRQDKDRWERWGRPLLDLHDTSRLLM